jgi:hypothetical protein
MNPVSKNISEIPIFFIVGRGRSGSTLLRTLFDAHPEVCIPLESRFVQYLYYYYPQTTIWSSSLVIEAIDVLKNGFEPLDIDKAAALKLLDNFTGILSFQTVCKIIYLSTQSEFEKEPIYLIGDKNPRYSLFISQLIKIFPDARFIHLIRDYRDHLVSVKRSHRAINESGLTPIALVRWKYYNQQIQKQKKLFPEKFYTLRFEDLITDPQNKLKSVCAFLDLEYNPKMLDYISNLKGYYENESFRSLHESLKFPFDISKIGEAQNKLTSLQLLTSEALVGDFGKQFSYELKYPDKKFIKALIKLCYIPIMTIGVLRYRLKGLLYLFPLLMKTMYKVLLKLKKI